MVCFVCLACGWTDFAVNCFPLLGSSFFKGFVFSSVLSPYHRAARPFKLLLSIATASRCVRAEAKPKRRRNAAKISVI